MQPGAVGRQLRVDRAPTLVGVAFRRVDNVQQEPRALEMREELVAEADALARAFDQSRHVGDDELPTVRRLDRAEHRRERRERIVGDLRPRVRDARQQRRLARVRQPDERGVGEQLQAQFDRALLPGHADLGEARRLPRRRRVALVAAASAPSLGHDDSRSRARASRSAPARPDLLVRPDAREVAPARVGDEHDVAAAAAVAAVGPALGDELLAAEMDRAVAAAAGDHGQSGAIVEHRRGVGGD